MVAQQLAANGKDSNGRASFLEEGSELAPGQLYSTESGRYSNKVSL
jgi:hypothetical protein